MTTTMTMMMTTVTTTMTTTAGHRHHRHHHHRQRRQRHRCHHRHPRQALPALTRPATDAPDLVTTGLPVTYTLMIRNNGARSATGVTLTDALPAGVTGGAVTTTQGSCGGTNPVRCNLGRIASGGQVTVTFSVTPTAPGTITNQAWVAAKKTVFRCGNNSVSTATTRSST